MTATLEVQMSVRSSICQSITKIPKQHKFNHSTIQTTPPQHTQHQTHKYHTHTSSCIISNTTSLKPAHIYNPDSRATFKLFQLVDMSRIGLKFIFTFTATIYRATITSTEETVVIVFITNVVISRTVKIATTDWQLTFMDVQITNISIKTVQITKTTSMTFTSFTIGTVVGVMGSSNIANVKIGDTICFLIRFTGFRVDTLEGKRTISYRTLLIAICILTTFILWDISATFNTTFNVGWPITDRSFRILVTVIK